MFVIVQFPLADLRPLIPGGQGRLIRPNWRADSHPEGFIRGFGNIAARTQSGLSLRGERAFADCNNAVRFNNRIELRQGNLKRPLKLIPWFRRLYYDGIMSGRFEFGFLTLDSDEDELFRHSNEAGIDPSALGDTVLSAEVQIHSVDRSVTNSTLSECARALGFALLSATTENSKIIEFSPAETYGTSLNIGHPIVHARISSGRFIQAGRDRRLLSDSFDPEFFLTSPNRSKIRNSVVVQASRQRTTEETPEERIVRVLFAHINSVLYAYAHFESVSTRLNIPKQTLRTTVAEMLKRIAGFSPTEPGNAEDDQLHDGLVLVAKAFDGRADELSDSLHSIAKRLESPSLGENIIKYVKGLHDLVVKTAVETIVSSSVKGGGG
jgi:hypothetical protein